LSLLPPACDYASSTQLVSGYLHLGDVFQAMRRYAPLDAFEDGIIQFSGQPCAGMGRKTSPRKSDYHPRTSVGTLSHGIIDTAGFSGRFTAISCRTNPNRVTSLGMLNPHRRPEPSAYHPGPSSRGPPTHQFVILSVLGQSVTQIPKAKIFVTGLPEPRIREGFHLPLLA